MREQEIRPATLLAEYLRLSAEDATQLLNPNNYVRRSCPACEADGADPQFHKNGFSFVRCQSCRTLYANPVPTAADLSRFYRDSISQTYWAEVFFPAVAEARREIIFAPRVASIKALADEFGAVQRVLCDVGAGIGLYLDEARRQGFGDTYLAVEPSAKMAETCRRNGHTVHEGFAADAGADPAWAGRADIATCFEVFEHMVDPATLIDDIATIVRPGGLIVLSGLCGTGFDILTLGADANAVSPPHHLTFVSEVGAKRLFERRGLELLAFKTPGRLDVDIVRNKLNETGRRLTDPFLAYLMDGASDATREAFQGFLAEHGLSSHMWLVARRPV